MRFRAARLFLLGLLLLRGGIAVDAQEDSQPTEYQIKAAFIFNFAKFVEWPSAAFPKPSSPIVVGVLGDNPFNDALEKTIQNKTVDEHPVIIMQFRTAAEATNCHILFISNSEKLRLPQILKQLNGRSVLTVGEMPGFTEAGGMINFVLEGTKIRFQINNDAAVNAGLKISAKLLGLGLRS
jgi:YfiR/HmsC-like